MPQPGTMQCVYKNVTLPLGHSYTDYTNCIEHSCSSDGSMTICGIGIHAGVMLPPDGCAILKGEKCAFEFVSARDQTIKCEADIFG
ncbi:Hypothetical predicted protein [Mytilus galloprovincialis]|nr:Hypothetical predicted protein [Mytilus galloprovincialis]